MSRWIYLVPVLSSDGTFLYDDTCAFVKREDAVAHALNEGVPVSCIMKIMLHDSFEVYS